MDKVINMPFYIKTSIFLVGLLAFLTILYIAGSIIIPLVFAGMIAILLYPLVNLLTRKKINRVISIVIVLIIAFLILSAFGALIFRQLNRFSESFPLLVDKFTLLLNQTIEDASYFYDINPQKIHAWIATVTDEIYNLGSAAIGQTLVILGNGLVIIFLIPVYVFMILFYQPLLRDFIFKVFNENKQNEVGKIVTQTKIVVQQYLVGLFFEFIVVAILNTTALMLLGIEYPILLGIIGALLNIIPYLGGIISVALYMLVALVTKSPEYIFYVFGAYSLIQFIDNNYIVPKIVASKVRINALFSIIVVIVGNALWGISGMFLSIPLLAIMKLIFDHIESLKPWGFLLGDTMPPLINIEPIFKKKKIKTL